MNEYEIGKDINDLSVRLSRLENAFSQLLDSINHDKETVTNDNKR